MRIGDLRLRDCAIGKHVDSSSTDFHLCQPDAQKSCGWCCGLYNVRDASKEVLVPKLRARTEEFSKVERSVAAIQYFSEKIIREEQSQFLDAEFHSCEYVGFLDSDETRVGCMLHPLARGNESIDYRGLSFHGTMACQGFFCRSYRELSGAQKRVILGTIRDWYLYGLVISDADYAKSFFRLTEAILERQVDLARLLAPSASELVHEFFHWKIDWPYRNRDINQTPSYATTSCNAKQSSHGQESLPVMDLMFARLDSRFKSSAELRSAKQKVHQLFFRINKLV